MIEARNLIKDYGRNRAVKDVSFSIDKGDIVGLLGPNGSGKTTIMRMLTGFFAPTSGECSIAGVDVRSDPRGARRHIGYLPERVALYPDMTVRAYLRFVARIHEAPGPLRPRVDDALERCGLTEMSKRHIGKLSKGYRQRVGIAQAIIHQPEVLILDEPTVGLDPRQIVEIRALIRALAGNATVLLSTHILPEVSITCRRVLILDRGRLVAEDTAAGLTARTVGHGQVIVRVGGREDEVTRALGAVEGVTSVDIVERAGSTSATYLIKTAGDGDPKPSLANAVARGRWPLYELTERTMSLEDLFVRILEDAGGERRQ